MSGVGTLASKFTLDTSQAAANMVAMGQLTQTQADKMVRSVKAVEAQVLAMAKAHAASAQAANDASNGLKESSKHVEEFGFKTAGAKRELLVLAHELSQGNFSRFGGSLLVLGERTGAASLLFSSMGVAALTAGAAVAGFAAAVVSGAHDAEELRKSLILTGNAAGQTSSSFDALAASSAAATGTTLGKGKDAVQALISTGRISQSVMADATTATLLMEKLTGNSADEIAKDFGKMGDGVAKWAQEHNKQYHYLTAAQFTYIKQLEDQGKLQAAEAENFRILNTRMAAVNTNLGTMERAWKGVKDMAAGAWDAMKSVGRAETTQQKIEDLVSQLGSLNRTGPRGSYRSDSEKLARGRTLGDQRASIIAQIQLLGQQKIAEDNLANSQAKAAVVNEAKIKAIMDTPKSLLDPKVWASFLSEIEKYNEESQIMAGNSKKVADYDKWAAEQKAKLRTETEKLTPAQMAAAQAAIAATRARRQDAEAIKKATDMEAEMQKLLADKHLVGPGMDFDTEKQTAATKYLNSLPDETKRAEQLVNGSFGRMEDAIVNFAKTGKLSFQDLWSFMAEEYLRNMIRMAEQKLLTDQAGNFIGWGGIASGIGSWFSSIAGSHATGLASVPYDGYPALLHKGERVQTAIEARNGSGNGGNVIDASINGLSVGAGVSMSQVHAAVNQAVTMSQQQIMRTLSQRGVGA